jgi:hypothetical protein
MGVICNEYELRFLLTNGRYFLEMGYPIRFQITLTIRQQSLHS